MFFTFLLISKEQAVSVSNRIQEVAWAPCVLLTRRAHYCYGHVDVNAFIYLLIFFFLFLGVVTLYKSQLQTISNNLTASRYKYFLHTKHAFVGVNYVPDNIELGTLRSTLVVLTSAMKAFLRKYRGSRWPDHS